jgi:hypothetical protein
MSAMVSWRVQCLGFWTRVLDWGSGCRECSTRVNAKEQE